jgi:xanthine dehydrogenase small subunit
VSAPTSVAFVLNGDPVAVEDGVTLLDALREDLGCRSVKDGCSPQGQCGCCTVWVDGAPRVACVTPARRIAGRQVTTLEGTPGVLRDRWAAAFVQHGASQCGFCTPGIVLRLAALEGTDGKPPPARRDIESALRAHLCRCTGWQSIVEAACSALGVDGAAPPSSGDPRNPVLAAWRAQIEGPAFQTSGPEVVLGGGGFADDSAPPDARVQLGADGALTSSLRAARARSGRVQGRNSTVPLSHPVEVPEGEWALTLQTSWLEPAYVEPDASWARPGQAPASPLANGGAFGGKRRSPVSEAARELADATGEAVRLLWRREDVVRRGPKRPPLAVALRADGSGVVRVGRTENATDLEPLVARVQASSPSVAVELVDVIGPPVSPDLRGAGWAEVLAARAALAAPDKVSGFGEVQVAVPGAGSARVELHLDDATRGWVEVDMWAGEILCPVTLRSYALGAVHQALGMVWSEGIALDGAGEPVDLTIRSFGILGARDMPDVTVRLHEEDGQPVNGSDAVFVATLAAAWVAEGLPGRWPTRRDAVRAPTRDVAASNG